jgi:hypothetical protein
MPASKDDFIQLQIEMIAKKIAWDDLTKPEQKMYYREAQNQLSKDHSWLVEEGLLEVPKKVKKKKRK